MKPFSLKNEEIPPNHRDDIGLEPFSYTNCFHVAEWLVLTRKHKDNGLMKISQLGSPQVCGIILIYKLFMLLKIFL